MGVWREGMGSVVGRWVVAYLSVMMSLSTGGILSRKKVSSLCKCGESIPSNSSKLLVDK